MCVMDRGRALHTKSSALSKHSLIQAKAGEKDLDSADNKRKTSAATQSTDVREEISAEVQALHPSPCRACTVNTLILVIVALAFGAKCVSA